MDTHREPPEIERKGKKLDIQRVFPVAGSLYSLTKAMVRLQGYGSKPDVLEVAIIHLNEEGIRTIILTDSELDALVLNIDQFRAELYEEYFYPTTDCCETKRPRDEVNTRDGIYCLEGYGCNVEHEEEPC